MEMSMLLVQKEMVVTIWSLCLFTPHVIQGYYFILETRSCYP